MTAKIFISTIIVMAASNAFGAAKLEVVNSTPLVQQELSIQNMQFVCKDARKYVEDPVTCRIDSRDLGLPQGGKIVDAKTDSDLVNLSAYADAFGVTIRMTSKGKAEISADHELIDSAFKTGQIKINLLYQGPALK
jgi:hypothetical protein